jgi:dipeptidyl aminopeptidase/acylaminoacyl peptidase
MRARIGSLALAAALVAATPTVGPAQARPGPRLVAIQLAYWGGLANGIRTASLDGTVATTIVNTSPYFSMGGGTVAAGRGTAGGRSTVYGFAATDGAQRFSIHDATFPLISSDGGEVVFLPDANGAGAGDRDHRVNSVWAFDPVKAKDHRLIRFADADRAPLNLALSPAGRLVAVTHGNDADLFRWDIWTARVHGTPHPRRLTTDGRSLYPSFSPSGRKIAFTKKIGKKRCSGSIWVMNADGTGKRRVAAGTCARTLLRPVWLNGHTLAAWWWNRTGVVGLVKVDVASGAVSGLAHAPVIDYSVSRSVGDLAYRTDDGTIRLYDISSGTKTVVPGGTSPSGPRVFLDGALELGY